MSLTVATLLSGLDYVASPGVQLDAPVAGITDDSRQVHRGDVFIAVRGAAADGHDFAAQVLAAGAAVVLCERPLADNIPCVVVPDLARARSELAGRVLGHPSRALQAIGVTGTNGKTSVAHYIAQLATSLQRPCGYLGTIGWGRLDALSSATLTTADAISLQQRLKALRDDGCTMVALEASSHALAQGRLAAVAIAVAVFTNLTRDHMDFHGSLQAYADAKKQLFVGPAVRAVVTNLADPVGQEIAAQTPAAVTLVGYGPAASVAPQAMQQLTWSDLQFEADGIRGRWDGSWGSAAFRLPLLGAFAVANVAAALAALLVSGAAFEQAVAAANSLHGVPGRMEPIMVSGQPLVVVDYAHTPDALAQALAALRAHSSARLLLVFGCGGDRDRGKRAQMGAIGAEGADVVYLTSDNPRSEDPEHILDDICSGIPAQARAQVHRISDRGAAIRAALGAAGAQDLVLIAGKGHEDYQEVLGRRLPFDDRALARELLENAA